MKLKALFSRATTLRFPAPTYQSWVWLVPLLLLAAGLGGQYLNGDNFWFDEVHSLMKAGGAHYPRRTPVEVWRYIANTDPFHPPGFFWVLAGWGRVAGWTPFADRTLALFFGMLAVATTYRAGGVLFSRRVGFFAAAVMSSSAVFVYFMHELRQYTALTWMTVFTLWMYWRAITSKGSDRATMVGFFVGALSLPYLNYMGLMPLAAIALYHLVRVTKDRRWWSVTILMTLAGVCFLPWVGTMWRLARPFAEHPLLPNTMTPSELLLQVGYAFSNANLPLLVIALAYAIIARGRSSAALSFITAVTMILYAATNFELHVLVKERLRYLLPLWPFMALLVALGIEQLSRRGLRPELFLGVWLVTGIWHSPGLKFARQLSLDGSWTPNWQALAASVKANERSGDAFAFFGYNHSDASAFSFYTYNLKSPTFFIPSIQWYSSSRSLSIQQAAEYTAVASRFWVAYDMEPASFTPTEFQQQLAEHYAFCGWHSGGPSFWLQLFARIPDPPSFRFGDSLLPPSQVLGLSLVNSLPAEADNVLEVQMGWSASGGIPANTYQGFLSLSGVDGVEALRQEFWLPAEKKLCLTQALNIADLTPGEYEIHLTLLAWGSPLPGEQTATGEKFNIIALGSFRKVLPPYPG